MTESPVQPQNRTGKPADRSSGSILLKGGALLTMAQVVASGGNYA